MRRPRKRRNPKKFQYGHASFRPYESRSRSRVNEPCPTCGWYNSHAFGCPRDRSAPPPCEVCRSPIGHYIGCPTLLIKRSSPSPPEQPPPPPPAESEIDISGITLESILPWVATIKTATYLSDPTRWSGMAEKISRAYGIIPSTWFATCTLSQESTHWARTQINDYYAHATNGKLEPHKLSPRNFILGHEHEDAIFLGQTKYGKDEESSWPIAVTWQNIVVTLDYIKKNDPNNVWKHPFRWLTSNNGLIGKLHQDILNLGPRIVPEDVFWYVRVDVQRGLFLPQ